ncbi:hypothetical protein KC8_03570 [Sphingomonas sp. KC8]|nr:hypothetical protein KC8_03570 [Sphingomonas sp. KC8]
MDQPGAQCPSPFAPCPACSGRLRCGFWRDYGLESLEAVTLTHIRPQIHMRKDSLFTLRKSYVVWRNVMAELQ